MKYHFDHYRNKNGWHILVIEGKLLNELSVELHIDDRQALELYKYIGQNFDVEEVDS